MNKSSYLLVFAALIVGIAFNSFFIVDEKEKAIVNYGMFTTQVRLEALDLVQAAKIKK